ncbi:MAG: hypothetical protein KDE56_23320 [Anaerolineales bacterium]|nr:hypothetical protein [Anaerolineales bacterium]
MLQVIGAGFGRTGTHSLALALDKLGFGPCYTILDVDQNVGHWQLWNNALNGKSVNWNALFQSYQSAVEWPTISFLPQLINHFPQAKIILTMRDPDSWYESATTTIFPGLEATAKHPDPEIRERSTLNRRLILEHVFSGKYWDKVQAIHIYQNHIEAVEKLVPADRLLRYHVKEGWPPLCTFLEVPEPAESFPKRNARASFLASAPEWAKQVMDENRQKRENQRLDVEAAKESSDI